jgi:hypothetical protein
MISSFKAYLLPVIQTFIYLAFVELGVNALMKGKGSKATLILKKK